MSPIADTAAVVSTAAGDARPTVAARALEVTVTAPVVSFRDPLYSGVQVTLPCPSPATVGGMLAAAAGGWDRVDEKLGFAFTFRAGGTGVDLETYHPLEPGRGSAQPAPRNREFLADVTLCLWLWDDPELWRRRLRRPRWPLRLGRSQDLIGLSIAEDTVPLYEEPGHLGAALAVHGPDLDPAAGRQLRMPCAVTPDRDATRWGTFRFDVTGRSRHPVPGSWSTADGRAVVPLPSPHPATVRRPGREAAG
ncbi:CRISPR-associated protein Cas5 [Streptomyces sp. ST2-7A]|uniref:CRISPR-associated protein Cas5 n=1 Tax=Streptomyces sp. ST2-7A TaxID=2907214 RepID=UPI001F215D0B|nr:CRISPR-associated protein Cas5 [Streptomyces sp. ST2-7A]MCE7079800.1 CRISPR-associated protein Cas5 [Streptomyces sp. ST2-7A]